MALSLMVALALGYAAAGQEDRAPEPLPSAVFCAALFAITLENLQKKTGDAQMTKGFREDAAALRRIVIAGFDGPNAEAAADAAIAREKRALSQQMAAMSPSDPPIDPKPCYRVKALGPRGE